MDPASEPFAIPLLLVGVLLVTDRLLQASLRRTAVPAVVVHLALGAALALAEPRWGWLGAGGREVIDLLGGVGIVFLLFRVGLESNVRKLAENLRGASVVWIGDVSVSGLLGFLVARYGLDLGLVPSLFVAVSLTATSVGVSVAVWYEEGALDSKRGQMLLDVAELDDISGIVLLAILAAVAPLLEGGHPETIAPSVLATMAQVLVRLVIFAAAVALFAHFLEAPLTRLVARLEPAPYRLVTVVSIGLIVAAAAGAVGFSLAIGAFFGGLAFSRDPEAVKLDAYFDPLYGFFTPFFFVSIGMRIAPEGLDRALPLGLLLFLVAAVGKLLGAGLASLVALPPRSAGLLGLSMVPRAEIAMIIMQHGMLLGAWAVSRELFSGMVVVSLATCLVAPIGIRLLLRRSGGAG